jgi:hypothetical protein
MRNVGLDKLHPNMRDIVEQTIRIVDLMYSEPVRSDACIARARSGAAEYMEDHEWKPCTLSPLQV